MNRPTTRIAALTAGVLLLAECGGFRGAYSLDLPGGADLGDDPYTVTVQFLDVLDLVPQSGVRVADVPVGRVDEIELNDDWTAEVTLTVNGAQQTLQLDDPRVSLLDALRQRLDLTGTKKGCDHGQCGAVQPAPVADRGPG